MKSSAFENFSEKAIEALDFARCQRPDGSFYGTSGQCRKGAPTGAKEKEASKGRSSKGGTPKRDDSKDLKNRKGQVIGTSPRNMLIDNIKMLEGRLKDSRSDAETKLLKDSISKAKAKLASEDKAAKSKSGASKPAADPDKAAKSQERSAKQLKKAKNELRMEANSLKQMRDMGITDNRIAQASSRVRSAKAKLEKLRNTAAKKSGKARPEKSTMTSRLAKEERDISRKAGAGNAKAKRYVDLRKRIQAGKVEDPVSARRQLASLRSELKPASSS